MGASDYGADGVGRMGDEAARLHGIQVSIYRWTAVGGCALVGRQKGSGRCDLSGPVERGPVRQRAQHLSFSRWQRTEFS